MNTRLLRRLIFSALVLVFVADSFPLETVNSSSSVVEAQRRGGGFGSNRGRRGGGTRGLRGGRSGRARQGIFGTRYRVRRDAGFRRLSFFRLRALRGRRVPHGFADRRSFVAFGAQLHSGLADAGHADTIAYLGGSAVTGINFNTGVPFDAGRTSDLDVALVSTHLLARAKELGIDLRGGGTRTRPLKDAHMSSLGLESLHRSLSQTSGRPVKFMIYDSPESLFARRQPVQEIP